MGYRKPMPDGTRGTDTLYAGPGQPEQQMTDAQKAMLDVYLVESGNQGIYGYCAPDLKAPHTATTAPGYCGVDNDFSTSEFGAGTDPVVSLEATAAHEFFHAVQFGYDRLDDTWLMESTAAWIEDEVYNDANDNRQYLSTSGPLTYPGAPLDFYDPNPSSSSYYTPYGDWIFWKLVSETYSPDLIRQVWYRASRSGQYSVSALRSVLADHGTTLTRFFARFGAVNRYPAKVYSEGRYYPRAPLARTFVMSPDRLVQRPLQAQMSQLSNLSVQYKAKDTLTGTRSLRIRLDMAPTYRGSAATLVVHFRDGSLSRRPVGLDTAGNGAITVPFTRSVVANVELTLTNASGRFDCSARDYRRACHGTPKDEGVAAAFTASVVR
ncbi:MAG: MXAN_6640 family putative metalloprotease, partial [Nocardioides sp.]